MPEISLKEIVGGGYGEFWRTRKRYRILKGGRSSKKSTTTSLWYIYNVMKYPAANLLVVRKIHKDNKDSTFAQLKWAIHRLNVSDYWVARVSPLEIEYLPTGQKILFRGLDDPLSITSITVEKGYLCWVWFEEFYQIASEEDFNKVDMSIRGEMPEGLYKQITGTLNPWNDKHWIKKRFFDNPDENTFSKTTNYSINEFLGNDDRRLFELMKKHNPRRYAVEGLGNWGVAEGLVFDNWEELDFNAEELIKQNPNLISVNGLDFGYTADPTAFINSLVDLHKREIWITGEHYQKGMLNSDIAGMIRYKGFSKSEIIADSAEPKSIEEIKRLGIMRIKGARKGQDSIINGIQFLQQFRIYVHPSCTNTILELNNYAWDSKNGRMVNKPVDDYNHIIDALRYSMERFMTAKKILKAVRSLF